MGKWSALSDGVVKKIILSYTYVAVWIFLSFSVIVYNKYILDRKLYNWPLPISLTMIHMAFCSSLAFFLVRIVKLVEPVWLSRHVYLTSVLPIGALYSLSLWLSNSAYIYLSVSFIQMLKALMHVAVYSLGILFKKYAYKSTTMCNMIAILIGVVVGAYGEAKYDSWGISSTRCCCFYFDKYWLALSCSFLIILMLSCECYIDTNQSNLAIVVAYTKLFLFNMEEKATIFALSQVAYGASIFVGYWAYFLHRVSKPSILMPFRCVSVFRTVFYYVCKSYHHQEIDKSALYDHLGGLRLCSDVADLSSDIDV